MATLFEDFAKWYPILSSGRSILANIKAKKFDPEKDRARATQILVEMLKDGGETEESAHAQAAVFQRDSEEDDIKGMGEAAKVAYEPKVQKLFTTQWSNFYDSAPKGVQSEVYSLLEHSKPKSNLTSLTGDIKKGALLHATIGGLGIKLERYLHGRVHGAEAKEIEKEVQDRLSDYYDKKFMNTPERATTFGKMVEVLKKWAKKKPQRGALVFHQIYEKKKEEFQKLIVMGNLKQYLTQAMDSDELMKLYSTANLTYEQSQGRKRALDSSGMLPVFADAA